MAETLEGVSDTTPQPAVCSAPSPCLPVTHKSCPPRGTPNLAVPPAFPGLLTGSQALGYPPRKAIVHLVRTRLIRFWVLHGFISVPNPFLYFYSLVVQALDPDSRSSGLMSSPPPCLPAQALHLSC